MLAEANLMIVSVALTDRGVSLPVLLLVKFEQILARDAPGEQPQQLACDEPREGRAPGIRASGERDLDTLVGVCSDLI